jgi:hypothetical protein
MSGLKQLGMIVISAALAGGCMGPPKSKLPMGGSVKRAVAQQTANPTASDRVDPTAQWEGRAAAGAMERYFGRFEGEKGTANSPLHLDFKSEPGLPMKKTK